MPTIAELRERTYVIQENIRAQATRLQDLIAAARSNMAVIQRSLEREGKKFYKIFNDLLTELDKDKKRLLGEGYSQFSGRFNLESKKSYNTFLNDEIKEIATILVLIAKKANEIDSDDAARLLYSAGALVTISNTVLGVLPKVRLSV